jgi:uncharacterized membrane protein required for colicin V production
MGKLDIAIIILVGLGGFSCFRAGFTRSVWGIAAVSAGVFTASQLWRELAPLLQRLIKHEGLAKWVSIIAITVCVTLAVDFLFNQFQQVMEKGVLGWVNSLVGAVFGVWTSSILIGCVLLLVNRFGGETLQEAIAESYLAPTFIEIARTAFDFGKTVIKEQAGRL